MNQATVRKILNIQEQVKESAGHQQLMAEYEQHSNRFLEVLPTLTAHQQAAILDYVGAFIALYLKMLELACEI